MSTRRLPKQVEYAIIGGGVVGCAIAYHLTARGKRDVLILERGDLASQTTGQGAGLCGQLRLSVERVRLAMRSVRTFSRFRNETGHDIGWQGVGSLRLSTCDERDKEFVELAAVARKAGVEAELIAAGEVKRRCPPIRPEGSRPALWCPSDGYLSAPALARGYASAANDRGAAVFTNTTVTGIRARQGAVESVETTRGAIEVKTVINAAGVGARAIAAMVGLDLPIVPVRHSYLVTNPLADWKASYPVVRIPDRTLYLRPDGSRLLLGGFEADCVSLDPRTTPTDGSYPSLATDDDLLARFSTLFAPFWPGAATARIERVGKGWPTFTPDGRYLIGPTAKIGGFVFAAGCNAHGVSGSAGLAEHLIEALFDPNPSPYTRSLSPDRFGEGPWDSGWARRQAEGVYGSYYSLAATAQGGGV